jgi:hypothetical protein
MTDRFGFFLQPAVVHHTIEYRHERVAVVGGEEEVAVRRLLFFYEIPARTVARRAS